MIYTSTDIIDLFLCKIYILVPSNNDSNESSYSPITNIINPPTATPKIWIKTWQALNFSLCFNSGTRSARATYMNVPAVVA